MTYSKYILTISVALNLILIGYLVGTQSMNIFSTKEKQGSKNRMINIILCASLPPPARNYKLERSYKLYKLVCLVSYELSYAATSSYSTSLCNSYE